MSEIHDLRSIEAALATVTAQTTTAMLSGMTLDRVLRLAEAAGSPHQRLRVVHVAGTSGKTSTSYMTAYLLRRAGKKVGLTVSPGVVDIREWVQLDDRLMSIEEFAAYFAEFQLSVAAIDFTPTRFEYLMVFALWVFDQVGVDYAVIETGLGGLVDASNICQRPDKVCIITDIGFDHVGLLGGTLEKIAFHKAGIIAPRSMVVMYEQGSEVMAVVRETAASKEAELFEFHPNPNEIFMRRNARLGYAAYRIIAERDNLPALDDDTIIDQVTRFAVPGRFQLVGYRGFQILLDGVHNQQKMAALVSALDTVYPGVRWSAVYAMKADKDYRAVITEIAPLLKQVVATPLEAAGRDMVIESVAPEELSAEFGRYGVVAETASSTQEGLDRLIDQSSSNILVTGSLYAVAEVMRQLR